MFGLFFFFSVTDGFEWFWIESLYKNNSFNAGVLQGFILRPALFLLYIHDLLGDVNCDIAIYADDTTVYSKCDQASDL